MRRLVSILAASILLASGSAARAGTGNCFATPSDAIRNEGPVAPDGFRLEHFRFDVLRGKSWAVVRSCEHPERPSLTVEAAAAGPQGQQAAAAAALVLPIVKAGARVRMVQIEAQLRLELAGITEASGALGDRIRVRLLRPEAGFGAPDVYRTGIVRGPDYLEMEP